MSSQVEIGVSVIPNPVAEYDPKRFEVLSRDRVNPVVRPEDRGENSMFTDSVRSQIAYSGSYVLSPFCVVVDSDANVVEGEDGSSIPWRRLIEPDAPAFRDTPYTTCRVTDVCRISEPKQAYRYVAADGTRFDVTPEHRFITRVDGQRLELSIDEIWNRGLPLLRATRPALVLTHTLPEAAWEGVCLTDRQDLGFVEVADVTVSNASHSYLLSNYLTKNSFNFDHHSNIYSIISEFKKITSQVVLSSTRIDAIARDPGLVDLITEFGTINFVTAVEGISARLCNFMQKSLLPDELYAGLSHIINSKFRSLKLYYIYTGMETDADLDEFEQHLMRIDELRRRHGKPDFPVRLSFTPLLSTLGTPLQYHGTRINRSVRDGSHALFRIRHMCARFGFAARLSTSVASSDFSQICESLDRRGAGLLEYLSLCGTDLEPVYSFRVYSEPELVDRKTWSSLPPEQRHKTGSAVENTLRHYRLTQVDRFSGRRLYSLANAGKLFPEVSLSRLNEMLRRCDGAELTQEVLDILPPRAKHARFGRVVENPAPCHVHDYKGPDVDGAPNRAGHLIINLMVDDTVVDKVREIMPLFTGGVTFGDIAADKPGTHVFPHQHIKTHANQHVGSELKNYVSARSYVFESYCFSANLAKSLPGNVKVRVRTRLAKEGEVACRVKGYAS